MENNVGLLLTKRAFLNPNREAYVDGQLDCRLTYAELNDRCNRLANAMLAAGVVKQQRVGLLVMNSAEFMESYFALAKIGAVVVPLNWRLTADELEYILKDSGTQRLIFGGEFIDVVTELHERGDRTEVKQWLQIVADHAVAKFAQSYQAFRDSAPATEPTPRASNDDMLYIMYTSGTTGRPKGVIHTHHTAFWGVLTVAATTYYHDRDRYLGILPMFHVGALTPFTVNVYRGATNVVMRSFDAQRAWELIEQERVTTGLAVPAMLNFMLQVPNPERFDRSSLRWLMTGAAPVPVSLLASYAAMGIEIHQVYGLTESCGPACVIDPENAARKIGSTGKAFFHTDVRLVNHQGAECAPGETGELLVRGEHVMRGYWNLPEATAETLAGGWLHTGDVAVMDTEGYVFIQDRLKDMIISGGENVYPAEIENVLMTHPAITDAAVIGQPSRKWGESPFAIVVRADNRLTADEVLVYCRTRLAGFKHPKGAAFVDEIPRNPAGKILKRILRERFPGPATV